MYNTSKKYVLTIVVLLAAILILMFVLPHGPEKEDMTQEEIDRYMVYCVTPTDGKMLGHDSLDDITAKDIIAHCTVKKEETQENGSVLTEYTSEELPAWLPEFKNMIMIFGEGENLRITYEGKNEKIVDLGYNDQGIVLRGVYEKEADIFYELGRKQQVKQLNYYKYSSI